ncbi:MAG: helix-turn-helix transcriptional regulator [Candidatus Omnitrophica bacterium]|nr:helix-turn-helix transcriptional regulator [Candidatus Omnitrophota bacterium]
MYIGKRLKELREENHLTLKQLAEKSGVQIATLSRIEHMKMVGTLESHMKIAEALGADITQLYTNLVAEEEKINIKNDETDTDIFVHSDKSSYEILTAKVLSKKMMPVLVKIEPKGKTNKEKNRAGTEKFIYVLDGQLTAHIGEKVYTLSKTHSLYFDASVSHYFENASKSLAKALCVTTPAAL